MIRSTFVECAEEITVLAVRAVVMVLAQEVPWVLYFANVSLLSLVLIAHTPLPLLLSARNFLHQVICLFHSL